MMLQQTQVARVEKKFPPFLDRFPGFEDLARAPFPDVLQLWEGLGYNRRARYMHQAAQALVSTHGGTLPRDPETLRNLPGIGAATAGSMAAFAYNVPAVFIETNIRRVFIHHFFPNRLDVADREITPLVAETLDEGNPREWYWALMDYGVVLARTMENPNRRSRAYARQAPFQGSDRQLRGMILRDLTRNGVIAAEEVPWYGRREGFTADRVRTVMDALEKEGFLLRTGGGEIILSR